MSGLPNIPNVPGMGSLQQKAAQLKAQMEKLKDALPAPAALAHDLPEHHDPTLDVHDTHPVGQGDYLVKKGDCISSIAKSHGYFWEIIWNHPSNRELREARKDPNVLLPGDRVTLPTKTKKKEPGATELRHRFVRRGEPAKIVLRVLEQDRPRADEPYRLVIDGKERTGFTDWDGKIREPIPGDAKRAKLIVGEGQKAREYQLKLGHLDPVESIRGVQARLNNLGFACGRVDGLLGPKTQAALRRFQNASQLSVTGEPDDNTRKKLKERHGS